MIKKDDLIKKIINRNLFFVAPSMDEEKWILLKKGVREPLFFDVSRIIAYPDLMQEITQFAIDIIKDKKIKYDLIMGAPYGGLPLSYCLTFALRSPCLTMRKEGVKKDGTIPTAGEILGIFEKGDKVLIVEDAILSGNTAIEFALRLRRVDLEVTDVLAIVDVGRDGIENLKAQNICLHSMFAWKDLYDGYKNENPMLISSEMREYLDNILNPTQH